MAIKVRDLQAMAAEVPIKLKKWSPVKIRDTELGVLGGGFKYFLFSSLFGEDEPILTNIFRWVETTNQSCV